MIVDKTWTSFRFSIFWILCFCHERVIYLTATYLSQISFWKNTRQSHTLVSISSTVWLRSADSYISLRALTYDLPFDDPPCPRMLLLPSVSLWRTYLYPQVVLKKIRQFLYNRVIYIVWRRITWKWVWKCIDKPPEEAGNSRDNDGT